MAENWEPNLIPIVDEDGLEIGLMDEMTAEFLASTDPDPTQESLDAAFDGVTRVRLLGLREDDGYAVFDALRLEVTDPAALTGLVHALRILHQREYGHCLCIGDHTLELWKDEQHVHTLGLHHWTGIRWSGVWGGDAELAEPRRLADWLLGQGITDARDALDDADREKLESDRRRAAWAGAMPPSLRPLWPERLDDWDPDLDAARALLAEELPDSVDRVRALYAWFGAGAGPWSGYPSYEGVAEDLLMDYPIETLVAAVDPQCSAVVAHGAARLFSGWAFGNIRKADRVHCPESLRQRMFDAVRQMGYDDSVRRFEFVFGL